MEVQLVLHYYLIIKSYPQKFSKSLSRLEKIIIKKLINFLKNNNLKFFEYSNYKKINSKLVSELTKKKIIAIFRNNRFGSRALSNTSILCDPRLLNAKKIINSKVKLREKFRPFAPSILEQDVKKWFKTSIKSPYMSFALKISRIKKKI